MPVPSPRNKLLPVRGNIATLQANVASILEGEICYALDEDQYYQKEGGVLVSVGATKAQGALADTALQPGEALPASSSIDALSDVDVTTTPPTNGQALVYNGSLWVPGAGGGGGASALNDLTDVNIVTLNGGDVLTYDGVAGEWNAQEQTTFIFEDQRTISTTNAQIMNFTMKAGEMYQAYLRLTSGTTYFSMSSILYSYVSATVNGADIAFQGTRLQGAGVNSARPTYNLTTATSTTCRFTLMRVG